MSYKIVGLAGGAGVGKDTLAKKFFQPKGLLPVALADEIKLRLLKAGAATFEELFVTKPPHIRKLIQEEGTERGFMVHGQRYWCEQLVPMMDYYHWRWNVNFVIPDIRFPHEVEWVKEQGGVVYQIVAPERYAANGMKDEQRNHISERALDGMEHLFDGFIDNDPKHELIVGITVKTLLKAHRIPMSDEATYRPPTMVTASPWGTITGPFNSIAGAPHHAGLYVRNESGQLVITGNSRTPLDG